MSNTRRLPMSRRGFLGLSALVTTAAATGGLFKSMAKTARAEFPAFVQKLPIPKVLTAKDITLVARETDVQLAPGLPTKMWTYNGTFPGPTIRRPSGTRTRVRLQNKLPKSADSLTMHLHGGHNAPGEDGQPEVNVIKPGAARTYTYDFREDGAPERAATHWYHDHSHHRTLRNVWHGLAGMFIVDDAFDAKLPLPKGRFDIPLMLTERTLDGDNQLVDTFITYDDATAPLTQAPGLGQGFAPLDDVFGTTFFVNGAVQPYLEVEPRMYRFRILNASPFRPYNLELSDGTEMVLIGTESGLLPAPLRVRQLLIGPAERAEIVIDFSTKRNKRLTLDSVEVESKGLLPRTAPALCSFMQFVVDKGAPSKEAAKIPTKLRPLPAWAATASSTPHRVWAFGIGVDPQGRGAWTINGRTFDPARVDAKPALGSVETWMLINTSPNMVSHYIHIHDVDWVVLSRNGSPPQGAEVGLKETFRLDPGEVVIIAAKFSDYLGRYMLHCHMLAHEDHGMMTTFEVVKPGQSDLIGLNSDGVIATQVAGSAAKRVSAVAHAAVDGEPAAQSLLGKDEVSDALPWWCRIDGTQDA